MASLPSVLLWMLVGLGALVVLGVVVYHANRLLFVISHRSDEIHLAVTSDGWNLALNRYLPRGQLRYREPVLLCHGLGVNALNVDADDRYSLARRLASEGFETWVVHLRGGGLSKRRAPGQGRSYDFGFDEHALRDAPAALATALSASGAGKAFWVGHSMGGMIGYVLAQGSEAQRLVGLVAISSPTGFPGMRGLSRLTRISLALSTFGWVEQEIPARLFAPLAGASFLPYSRLVLNPDNVDPALLRRLASHVVNNMSAELLAQFHAWIEQDCWRSRDGSVDYQRALERVELPVLLIGGADDRLASAEGVRATFERLRSVEDKTLLIFGREFGHSADYGHGDIVFGRRAPEEVFPAVVGWLKSRATELPAGASPEARA